MAKIKDIKKRLGWKPQKPDSRDYSYRAFHAEPNTLPPRVDLRSLCPPILDQGSLGSCVANAVSSVFRFALKKQKQRTFQPSRLFIYYNARAIEGWENEDSGANIRDGFKTINHDGVCVESSWKYTISKFADKPPARTYKTAETHQAIEYAAVGQTLNELKACIADGFPFCFGFSVYESFERIGADGVMPYPQANEQFLGGHAVYAAAYSDETQMFTIRNSWSKAFGDGGDFYMPYSVITNPNLASDFWTLRLIEGK